MARTDQIKKLYETDQLKSICTAAKTLEEKEFSSFQRETLHAIFPNFCYDFCTTSLIVSGPNFQPVQIETVCLGLPDDALENYRKHAHHDDLSILVYKNPGRALQYTHIHSPESIHKHPIFIKHCSKYGIHKVTSIGFQKHGHQFSFLAFDYMGDKTNDTWHLFDHSKLELASFPFALAWLFRYRNIDEAELNRCCLVLNGLGERALSYLRKFINSPEQTFKEQATDLGINAGTIKDELASVRDQLYSKLNTSSALNSGGPLRSLERHYGFMRMLGDQTAEIDGI